MPKLLLMDDCYPEHFLVKHVFLPHGWSVTAVATAEEAMRLIDPSYDAVLLDWNLPGNTQGNQVLSAIRARRELTNTVVVMYSSSREPSMIVEAIKRGADDYFTKAERLEDIECLAEKVLSAVAQRRARIRAKNARSPHA